jgi:hypothetical protein
MSDARTAQRAALNWRGPLLAAAIFAGVFGVLLLMAHLNQSNTSDEGSSFRQDPYGTSLLFDSYERGGYKVRRSSDEKSLAEQDATRTTAFFIGGSDRADTETRDGKFISGAKFHLLLEDFLARGGRVVLLSRDASVRAFPIGAADGKPSPGDSKKEEVKSWGAEMNYGSAGKDESDPIWVAPQPSAMPAGSEAIYLAADAPWLKTDAQWTTLYGRPTSTKDSGEATQKDPGDSPGRVYIATRRIGKGELVVASQQSFLLNETIKTHPNPVLLDFLAGGRSNVWVDETLHGLHQNQGVLWLVQRYQLQSALLFFWAALLALLWSTSGDLVRRPSRNRNAEVIRYGQGAGVAAQRLLQRSLRAEQVVQECWEQFRRRSPQDAQAISDEPRWGPRLRAGLLMSPLAGYKELKDLIAERRASKRGLTRANRDAKRPLATAKTTLEEGRIV